MGCAERMHAVLLSQATCSLYFCSDCFSPCIAAAAAPGAAFPTMQVIGTATVTVDDPGNTAPQSADAIATINTTCAGSLLDINNGGGSAPAPATPAGNETSSVDGITVTVGDVGTEPVENVVWSLRLSPNGLTGTKVTKPAEGSLDLRFDVIHSRSIETVRLRVWCAKVSARRGLERGGDSSSSWGCKAVCGMCSHNLADHKDDLADYEDVLMMVVGCSMSGCMHLGLVHACGFNG